MKWRGLLGIWRHGQRQSMRDALTATRMADASRAQAEEDWLCAMESRVEAVRVTEDLRVHNAANHYDDWLPQIMRR